MDTQQNKTNENDNLNDEKDMTNSNQIEDDSDEEKNRLLLLKYNNANKSWESFTPKHVKEQPTSSGKTESAMSLNSPANIKPSQSGFSILSNAPNNVYNTGPEDKKDTESIMLSVSGSRLQLPEQVNQTENRNQEETPFVPLPIARVNDSQLQLVYQHPNEYLVEPSRNMGYKIEKSPPRNKSEIKQPVVTDIIEAGRPITTNPNGPEYTTLSGSGGVNVEITGEGKIVIHQNPSQQDTTISIGVGRGATANIYGAALQPINPSNQPIDFRPEYNTPYGTSRGYRGGERNIYGPHNFRGGAQNDYGRYNNNESMQGGRGYNNYNRGAVVFPGSSRGGARPQSWNSDRMDHHNSCVRPTYVDPGRTTTPTNLFLEPTGADRCPSPPIFICEPIPRGQRSRPRGRIYCPNYRSWQ